mmetsp:Transcript_12778/g.44814  ORF Transcript_12778/g.44814 Transcript_12778/m.44814 type:complete len:380 (-) Transcript_12778:231-1370(-)
MLSLLSCWVDVGMGWAVPGPCVQTAHVAVSSSFYRRGPRASALVEHRRSSCSMPTRMSDQDDQEEEDDDDKEGKLQDLAVARRSLLGLILGGGVVAMTKIYGESELLQLDSMWRKTFPQERKAIRPSVDPTFVSDLGDLIRAVAVEDLRLVAGDALASEETEVASKAASFFRMPDGGQQARSLLDERRTVEALWMDERMANLALYARIHTIGSRLASPLSRKQYVESVGKRFLQSSFFGGEFSAAKYRVKDPIQDYAVWYEGLKELLRCYTARGYGICSIGERGTGMLDEISWREDRESSFTVFVSDLAVNDAAQALAGESINDLAEVMLPTPVIVEYLRAMGIQCDAESYYLSSVYTRNPADYHPDSLAIQFNLAYKK